MQNPHTSFLIDDPSKVAPDVFFQALAQACAVQPWTLPAPGRNKRTNLKQRKALNSEPGNFPAVKSTVELLLPDGGDGALKL